MTKRKTILIAGLLFLMIAAVWISYLLIERDRVKDAWSLPDPNITVQTQSIEGLTFSLRNASYTNEQISLGIEVIGGGQAENDLGYEFYDGDNKFASSASGVVYKLGEQHYYLTVETDEVAGLSNPLDLRIKVLARSNPLEPQDLRVDFHVRLGRVRKRGRRTSFAAFSPSSASLFLEENENPAKSASAGVCVHALNKTQTTQQA